MSVEQKVYRAMISEIDARIGPLERELEALQSAGQRIAEIQSELQVLRAERLEYDALVPKEATPGPVTDTPKFDR